MSRFFHRPICVPVIVTAVVLGLLSVQSARAEDFILDPEQIRVALRASPEIDKGFIERTVKMVQAGTLPRSLFTSTFLWARKKTNHQFQYFKEALTRRAADVGIKL